MTFISDKCIVGGVDSYCPQAANFNFLTHLTIEDNFILTPLSKSLDLPLQPTDAEEFAKLQRHRQSRPSRVKCNSLANCL